MTGLTGFDRLGFLSVSASMSAMLFKGMINPYHFRCYFKRGFINLYNYATPATLAILYFNIYLKKKKKDSIKNKKEKRWISSVASVASLAGVEWINQYFKLKDISN